jgi:EAL domain-containing protein (putative c-di-GMP-specific phosphodiesterase class I)
MDELGRQRTVSGMDKTLPANQRLMWRSDLRQASEWVIRDGRRTGLRTALICIPNCPDHVRGRAVDAAERTVRSGVARSAIACLHNGGLALWVNVPSCESAHAVASRVRWAIKDAGVGVGIAFADDNTEDLTAAAAKLEHDAEAAALAANPGEVLDGGGARNSVANEAAALVEALRTEKLQLWYQPIVDLRRSNVVVGAEALVRWETGENQAVSADRFWEIAVEHGVETELTVWVLNRAIEECRPELTDENAEFSLHINVSLRQVDDAHFPDLVLSAAAGVKAQRIVLEIVESGSSEITARMSANLRLVRGMGIRIALDDFGKGWSSLERLSSVEWDIVKLDRTLCYRAASKSRVAACARAGINVAHECGALVVAEGVEHDDDAELLAKSGADYGQGYLWGRPGPVRTLRRGVVSATEIAFSDNAPVT